jgi:hypothetical protein
MVRFQKLIKMYFSSYMGITYTVSSGNCPKFFMRCQQFASHAYCRAAEPVSKMASQQKASFLNRARSLRGTVITDLNTSKWSTHKPSPAATPSWKLVPRPRSKQEKQTAGSTRETWTVPAVGSVGFARVGWKIYFLSTFETAQFFYVYPVLVPGKNTNLNDQIKLFTLIMALVKLD